MPIFKVNLEVEMRTEFDILVAAKSGDEVRHLEADELLSEYFGGRFSVHDVFECYDVDSQNSDITVCSVMDVTGEEGTRLKEDGVIFVINGVFASESDYKYYVESLEAKATIEPPNPNQLELTWESKSE